MRVRIPARSAVCAMSQDIGMAMNPHRVSRAPLDDHDADGTVRFRAGRHRGREGMPGRPGSVPPGGLPVQPAGPLAAGTPHRRRPECCPGLRMGHGAGQQAKDRGPAPAELGGDVQRGYQNAVLASARDSSAL
jgi:hypothetical protein